MKKYLLLLLFIQARFLQAQMPPICFDTAHYVYPLPSGLSLDLVSEDFNGDSIPDIASCVVASDKVILMTGNGDGSFNPASPAVFATGAYPQNLVAGDFNNDQRMDVVTVNSLSNSISLLLGTGTGSFLAQTTFSVGNFPKSLIKGDFNNDNFPDIAVSNYSSGDVSVLLGTGTGSFAPAASLAALVGAEAITTGDYNNDGKQDLAVCIWTYAFITVYYGNGNGTFQPGVNCPMYTFDNYADALTTADLNNDGYDDIVVHDDLNDRLTVFLGTSAFSLGTYTNVGVTTGSGNIHVMAVEDINGDGNADIVTPEANILLGLGNGSFLAPVTYTNFSGASLIVKDFNRDNKPDLGVIISTLYIVLNEPILHVSGLPSFVCPGYSVSLTASGASTYTWNGVQTGALLQLTPGATSSYTVKGTNAVGCTNKAVITVSVVPAPDPATLASMSLTSASPASVCAGEPVKLCVSGAISYSWSTGSNAACVVSTPTASTVYSVTVMNQNGCYKGMSYVQYVDRCLGVEELNPDNARLSVYPNPGHGLVYIEAYSDLNVMLLNALGAELGRFPVYAGVNTLDLTKYPSGIYLVQVAGQQQNAKRLVIEP